METKRQIHSSLKVLLVSDLAKSQKFYSAEQTAFDSALSMTDLGYS